VEQDPLLSFLSNLSEKINVEKEHRAIMEGLEAPETVTPLAVTLANLQEKIAKQVEAHLPTVPAETPVIQDQPVVEEDITEVVEEKDNFGDFLGKLKNILTSPPKETVIPPVELPIQEEIKEQELPVEEPKAPVINNDYIQELERQTTPPTAKNPTDNYVDEFDKLTSKIANVKDPEKIEDIKKLIEEQVNKHARRILELGGGGGSVAQQFANGGTMNGTLNVTGQYLSGGVDLATIFSGGGGGSQTLSFDPNTANLSSVISKVTNFFPSSVTLNFNCDILLFSIAKTLLIPSKVIINPITDLLTKNRTVVRC